MASCCRAFIVSETIQWRSPGQANEGHSDVSALFKCSSVVFSCVIGLLARDFCDIRISSTTLFLLCSIQMLLSIDLVNDLAGNEIQEVWKQHW